MAILIMVVGMKLLRILSLHSSRKLLRRDQERYDDLYNSLLRSEDSKLELQHLGRVVQMIGLHETAYCAQHNHMVVSKLPPRQRYQYMQNPSVIPVNNLFIELNHVCVFGRKHPDSVVTSINQMYASASIAHLMVQQRIKAWAESSRGMFILRSSDAAKGGAGQPQSKFVQWKEAKEDPALAKKIVWTSMKRFGRAIEKLLRNYQHKPSRLLDVSRNCIIFATVSDLTLALGNIITDDNIRVERLKNRLDPSHSSDETAGYRDVCLNLRVVNKQAMSLGADMHVCEVQLILLAKLRTSEGHKRYVDARNQAGV